MSRIDRPPPWVLMLFGLGVIASAALSIWGYTMVPKGGLFYLAWTGWMALIAVLNACILLFFLSRHPGSR